MLATSAATAFPINPGNPRKLLIVMDGGGACWDATTCIGTPLLGASSYSQTVDETPASLAGAGGVLDGDNPENPYSDYTNWGVVEALPAFMGLDEHFLAAAFATQPLFLVPGWFTELARFRPRAKLSMVTSNLDSVQIDFYALMEALDGRPLDDPSLPVEWYLKMQLITNATEGLRNYRTFIDGGTYHTILGSDGYYQPGESGVSVRDWNEAMVTFGREGWDHIDVGSPF